MAVEAIDLREKLGAELAANSNLLSDLLEGSSIEVLPRTLEKIDDIGAMLPKGSRVYIAHIDPTAIEDMRQAASRLIDAGFEAMPHFPARVIENPAMLEEWIAEYAALGVKSALVIAGGLDKPKGAFSDAMQVLSTGLFDKYGFDRLHVAGHPEGNRDIDPDGGDANVMSALKWKSDFAKSTDADMAIVTQFAFDPAPIIRWAEHLQNTGIALPVHIGVAGPAKLQTMIKFAMACGVGPSLRVLKRRARDLSKLLLPFEPDELLAELAQYKAANPMSNIEKIHFFPLGGIGKTAEYARDRLDMGEAASR